MRYYRAVITDAATGNVIQTVSSPEPTSTYTSFVNGRSLPGALNVELDVWQYPFHTPSGSSFFRIWGVSLQEISQASDLNDQNIALYAGMQVGLPLADPTQAGLIVEGSIFQAFGNWIGTSQTLDLILQPSVGTPETPKNIVINWKKGMTFAQAISTTLSQAFPGFTLQINVNPSLVLPYDQPGYYDSLFQFAAWVKQFTAAVIGGGYTGVSISVDGTTIRVFDGTSPPNPKQLIFSDLIGQPTWIDFNTIQVTAVMRADLDIGDFIQLPPQAIVTQSAPSFPRYRDKSVFQGTFEISQLHHVGNFRQPDAASWVTVVDAFAVTA